MWKTIVLVKLIGSGLVATMNGSDIPMKVFVQQHQSIKIIKLAVDLTDIMFVQIMTNQLSGCFVNV